MGAGKQAGIGEVERTAAEAGNHRTVTGDLVGDHAHIIRGRAPAQAEAGLAGRADDEACWRTWGLCIGRTLAGRADEKAGAGIRQIARSIQRLDAVLIARPRAQTGIDVIEQIALNGADQHAVAVDLVTGDPLVVIRSPPTQRNACLLYTSPSPRDRTRSRMPSSA